MGSQAGWQWVFSIITKDDLVTETANSADASATGYCSTKFALEGLSILLSYFKRQRGSEHFSIYRSRRVSCQRACHIRARAEGDLDGDLATLGPEPSVTSTTLSPAWMPIPQFNSGVQAFEQSVVGNEPGDSRKAVERMIELTKGTGMAAGKSVPLRVPLGTDGWTRIKAKCEETLRICDEWEEVAKSTDIEQSVV